VQLRVMAEAAVAVHLPCERVLSRATITTYIARVAGDGPVELCVHPGTRGYGDGCATCSLAEGHRGCDRVVAVSVQPASTARAPMLRRLIVALWMYEPALVWFIQSMVPSEPEVASVGIGAFERCSGLVSVAIPAPVTCIDYAAFCDCSKLSHLVIPATVTTIKNYAFSDCRMLTSIVIPDSVAAIDAGVFLECTALVAVELSATAAVADGAFDDCPPNLVITRRV
jgi:hypothetical protein